MRSVRTCNRERHTQQHQRHPYLPWCSSASVRWFGEVAHATLCQRQTYCAIFCLLSTAFGSDDLKARRQIVEHPFVYLQLSSSYSSVSPLAPRDREFHFGTIAEFQFGTCELGHASPILELALVAHDVFIPASSCALCGQLHDLYPSAKSKLLQCPRYLTPAQPRFGLYRVVRWAAKSSLVVPVPD